MKHVLIIYAHPDESSFNAAILRQIVLQLEKNAHTYDVIDLYNENYNPVLSKKELGGETGPETKKHQQLIAAATDIVFIFPVWWFRAPAILEGFIDKTFVPNLHTGLNPFTESMAYLYRC